MAAGIIVQDTFRKLPEKKQRHILDAAAEVFAQKGYFHANIAAICKKAGISNGALYKYFKNKQALFNSVFDHIIDVLREELLVKQAQAHESVYGTIQGIFQELVVLARRYPSLVAIYLDIGSCSMNRMAPPLSRKIEGEVRDFWIDLVRRGKLSGEINPALSDAAAAYSIDNHLNMLAYSLVSAHFDTRFRVYFGGEDPAITDLEKVRIIMESIEIILR